MFEIVRNYMSNVCRIHKKILPYKPPQPDVFQSENVKERKSSELQPPLSTLGERWKSFNAEREENKKRVNQLSAQIVEATDQMYSDYKEEREAEK